MTAVLTNPAAVLGGTWVEPVTLALMLGAFGLLVLLCRWPIGVALAAAAWAGAAFHGEYLPLRHLAEGAFSYHDPILGG